MCLHKIHLREKNRKISIHFLLLFIYKNYTFIVESQENVLISFKHFDLGSNS